MPRRTNRRYTAEFKANALRLALDTGHPTKVAHELGIPKTTMSQWLKERSTARGDGDTTLVVRDDKEEIARLREELERVKMERDFLKKAAAFFAKNQS